MSFMRSIWPDYVDDSLPLDDKQRRRRETSSYTKELASTLRTSFPPRGIAAGHSPYR